MAREVEVGMVGQIDWRRLRRSDLVDSAEGVVREHFVGDGRDDGPRVALELIRVNVRQNHFRPGAKRSPVELIEADGAAMQLMLPIQVFVHFVADAVEREPAVSDPIANTSNRRTEIRISRREIS